MSALASILVPCRDAAPFLARTLESALAQTWPRVEVIVVDDGSTDASLAIARAHEARGVKVVSQPNAGASAARNRAMREAQGDYVQFLDADDCISPDKIARQVEALERRGGTALASCRWGRFASIPEDAAFVDDAVFRDFEPMEFLIHCSRTQDMMHPGAWLVPRTLAERAGPWDESLTLNDDGEYFCRVMLQSDGIVFVEGPASHYRSGLHASLSRGRDARAARSQLRSIELIAGHMIRKEDSPRVRRAAANYYQRYVYDFYPRPAELIAIAERRIRELGGADTRPPMGPLTEMAARVMGWKGAWRLKRSGIGAAMGRLLHGQGERRK